MAKVPLDKLRYYSAEHLRLISGWEKLRELKREVYTSRLRKIIKEAFSEIAQRGIEVIITYNEGACRNPSEKGENTNTLYLFCDGDRIAIEPLLQFLPPARREEYRELERYLQQLK
jgi:hypothetical protein